MLAFAALLAASAPVVDDDDNKPRMLVLDLAGDAVSAETRRSITGLVVVRMSRDPRVDVVSGQELKHLADLEAGKQAAGCDDSCLAEIAGAMDAQLVVSGFVGKLGSLYVVNLSLFDAKKARAIGRATAEAEHVEDFASKLDGPIDAMMRDLPQPKPKARVPEGEPEHATKAPNPVALGLVGGGALGVVVAVACGAGAAWLYTDAESARGVLDTAASSFAGDARSLSAAHDQYVKKRDAYNSTGTALEWASALSAAAGVVVAGAGGALWVVE